MAQQWRLSSFGSNTGHSHVGGAIWQAVLEFQFVASSEQPLSRTFVTHTLGRMRSPSIKSALLTPGNDLLCGCLTFAFTWGATPALTFPLRGVDRDIPRTGVLPLSNSFDEIFVADYIFNWPSCLHQYLAGSLEVSVAVICPKPLHIKL